MAGPFQTKSYKGFFIHLGPSGVRIQTPEGRTAPVKSERAAKCIITRAAARRARILQNNPDAYKEAVE